MVVSTRQVRRLLDRRRGRRGIVLIFVVVLLMLLAIMGTAYLAASRADRTAIVSRGALGENKAPPTLVEVNQFDEVVRVVPDAVMMPLIEDMFNLEPGTLPKYIETLDGKSSLPAAQTLRDNIRTELQQRFRQEFVTPKVSDRIDFWRSSNWGTQVAQGPRFENYDAPGLADPWLASQFPTINGAGTAYEWPWISAPMRGETFLPPQSPPPAPGDFSPLSPTARPVTRSMQLAPFFSDPRLLTRSYSTSASDYPSNDVNVFTPYDRRVVAGFGSHYGYQKATAVDNPIGLYSTDLDDLRIDAVAMLASDATAPGAKTTRLYPALVVDSAERTPPDDLYIAADADGDGMADAGLSPVILNPDAIGIDRFLDAKNGVVYFVGYRIVDNSARINLNTALTAVGDVNTLLPGIVNGTTRAKIVNGVSLTPADNALNVIDGANLGFYRSNVGLAELMQMHLETFGDAPNAPRDLELQRLIDTRLPMLKSTAFATGQGPNIVRLAVPNDPVNNPAPAVQSSAWFDLADRDYSIVQPQPLIPTAPAGLYDKYEYRSLGDLLEQQVARRPDDTGGLRWWSSAAGASPTIEEAALVSLPVTDTLTLSARGGTLINDKLSPGPGESALVMSTRMAAPNFTANNQPVWKWFPLSTDGGPAGRTGAIRLWYEWTQNYSHATGDVAVPLANAGDWFTNLLDEGDPDQRRYDLNTSNGTGGVNLANVPNVPLIRSLRPLLTTVSGATNVVPKRSDGEAAYIGGVSANTVRTIAGVNYTLPGNLPGGMPYYAQSDADRTAGLSVAYDVFPAIRAAAATSTKEQLFRAYWSVMTQNDTVVDDRGTPADRSDDLLVSKWKAERNPDAARSWNGGTAPLEYWEMDYFDAFLPPDRHASAAVPLPVDPEPVPTATPRERLDENQMALIRAAIAASNTIDLRDSDNDLTAMTVDLGFVTKNNTGSEKLYARVYGTEKQLVISAVVIDVPSEPGVGDEFVAIELFNPSDEPLDLRGYYLSVVDRPAAAGTTLATGTLTAFNAGLTSPSLATMSGVDTIEPGGILVISSTPLPVVTGTPSATNQPVAGHVAVEHPTVQYQRPAQSVPVNDTTPTQLTFSPAVQLFLLELIDADREVLLMRTRRADGVAYDEEPAALSTAAYPRPAFTEVLTTRGDLLQTLAPVDGVDLRQLVYNNYSDNGTIHWYMRNTFNPRADTASAFAWKCFYAGHFFDVRPGRSTTLGTRNQATSPGVAATADFPWRTFPPDGASPDRKTAVGVLGRYRAITETGIQGPLPSPFFAPTIPIQKFRPWSRFYPSSISRNGAGSYVPALPAENETEFAPNKYPYGSPFARNGDVLSVPFIGSYKIYRQAVTVTGTAPNITVTISGTPPVLYEAVPLTMDAVNVAPVSADFASNPSVGRFDARLSLDPDLQNTWAADLFDFVTARQSSAEELNFPDLPLNAVNSDTAAAVYNDPLDPSTDQDGPVRGYTASPINGDEQSENLPWIRWENDQTGVALSSSRGGTSVSIEPKSQLIQGLINLNTAPFVVMRMLPWTVDATALGRDGTSIGGGRLDQRPGRTMNEEQRARTGIVMDAITTEQGRTTAFGPFGLTSLFRVAENPLISHSDPALTDYPTFQDRMRFGQLNPMGRPTDSFNFETHFANVTRVSNLSSQRSDAYTVYVTVQAWTWVGDTVDPASGNLLTQFNNTRLVGERRMTFVVDRSRVSATDFTPAALITYKAEDE
jgi:hypothetical protein